MDVTVTLEALHKRFVRKPVAWTTSDLAAYLTHVEEQMAIGMSLEDFGRALTVASEVEGSQKKSGKQKAKEDQLVIKP